MKLTVGSKTWIVDFQHNSPDWPPYYKGDNGQTLCWIYQQGSDKEQQARDGLVDADGVAICHINDNFNKRIGRKLAFGRALANLPRAERAQWWEAYFQAMPKDKNS